VGSGPYVLDSGQTSGVHLRVTRNAKYNQPTRYGFDRIEYKVIADTNAQVTSLTGHQVDTGGVTVGGLSSVKAAGLQTAPVSGLITGLFIVDRDGKDQPGAGQGAGAPGAQLRVDAQGDPRLHRR